MKRVLKLLRSKFVRDSATLQIGSLLTAAGNLMSAVVLANLLGASSYGVYVVATSLYAAAFLLLSTGFVQVTVSQVARFSAAKDPERAAEWLAFLSKTYLFLGLLMVVAGWQLIPPFVTWWAEVTPGELAADPAHLGQWVFWLTFMPLLDLPRVVAVAAFQGTRRMLALAQVENGTELVRVFLVIVGALVTADPTGPLLGTIAASAIGSIVAVDRYRRSHDDGGYALPGVMTIVRRLRAVPIREGVRAGMKVGVLRSCDALAYNALPPLIIQNFTSSEWVAYFRIAHRFMNFPVMLMGGVSRTALPALSGLAGERNMARFKRAYLRVTLLGGLIVLAGIAVFLPLIPHVTALLMPRDFPGPVYRLAKILAIGFLTVGFSMAVDSFFIVTNRVWVGVVLGIVGFFVTVPLSCFLAWRMPETGVAWGTVSSMLWAGTNLMYIAWYFRTARDEMVPGASAPLREPAGDPPVG